MQVKVRREGKVTIQGQVFNIIGKEFGPFYMWAVFDLFGNYHGKFYTETDEIPTEDKVIRAIR